MSILSKAAHCVVNLTPRPREVCTPPLPKTIAEVNLTLSWGTQMVLGCSCSMLNGQHGSICWGYVGNAKFTRRYKH